MLLLKVTSKELSKQLFQENYQRKAPQIVEAHRFENKIMLNHRQL
jgi:hypothetical protein